VSVDWTMPRRADVCAGCQRTFAVGEAVQAFLYDAAAGYERHDYCQTCQPPDQPAPLGVWKTRRPEPATRRVQPFDREAIYGFFERLEDAQKPHQVQFRFVLALLLWRKKVLRLERTVPNGEHEAWEFVAARTGTPHRVVRPDLDEHQLEQLSGQLEQLLAGQPAAAGELDIVVPDLGEESTDG
jgi:hypothetical protein